MKLRIKGNSIRLRLSKAEVEKLVSDGFVEEQTTFINTAFRYSLQTEVGIKQMSASFEQGRMDVIIPEIFIKDWAANEVVGFDGYMPINGTESLYILIEKDFKCLANAAEDQSDNYENPKTC